MRGTTITLLDLGRIDCDEGFLIRGCGTATYSNPHEPSHVRRVAVIAAVIDHPDTGPILYETGCAQNAREDWPAPAWEAFPINVYEERHHLDKALEAAGYGIDDIQAVVMGHLHLDHAGGLEHFRGRTTPVYAHELEIKEHYYAVATKEDIGAYVPGDLNWELNWQAVSREEFELVPGVVLRHMPGHTPGLMTLQAETLNCGSFIFTSDLFHVREPFEDPSLTQGWLQRNSYDWHRSARWIRHLQRARSATMVYGHDAETLETLLAQAPKFD